MTPPGRHHDVPVTTHEILDDVDGRLVHRDQFRFIPPTRRPVMEAEGFTPARDHYAMCPRGSQPGADRTLSDIDVVVEWSFVDPE